MARRERAASVRRAFTAPGLVSANPAAASRRAAQPAPSIADLPPVLDSLFDEAIESWLALQLPASQATPETLGRLGALAYRYTSRVSLDVDAVLLEVQGSARLFGGIHTLCAQLLERCRASGLEPRWALAPTPLAALVLARAGRSIMVRARDRLMGELAPLPVESLGWSAETLERLDSLGVRTLGALLRLPRAGFAKRFGKEALLTLDRLSGVAAEPRRGFLPREHFKVHSEPAFELVTQEAILQHLTPLLDQLEQFLRARQCGVDVLKLRLAHRVGQCTRLDVRLAAADVSAERFATVLGEQLARRALPAAVIDCELRSGVLQPFIAHSDSLWRPAEHGGALGRESPALIERLRARLGSEAVYGLCLVPQHRPEIAWRVAEPALDAPPQCTAEVLYHLSTLRRPLWLLRHPAALPCAVSALHWVAGPERIETGWWDGREVARDYYVVREPRGAQLWVYRERLPPHEWRWHGVFG